MQRFSEQQHIARAQELTSRLRDAEEALRLSDERYAHAMRDAMHDALTGLPNRALFIDRLEHAAARGRGNDEERYAVLYLDLDRFQLITDSLGHFAGDQLLIAVAKRLSSSLSPSDTVARIGGDEFTILLEDVRCKADAARVADQTIESLKQPFRVTAGAGDSATQEVFIGASIGIAIGGGEIPGAAQDLMRDADTALHRAKDGGGNQHRFFDTAMRQRALHLLHMETDLRRAIDRAEFDIDYQPIVQISTGRITAFEALIRWHHPERGLVMPVDFISVAEETGLICPIGKWILDQACLQAAAWRAQFPASGEVAVSVNLSARQFTQPDLDAQIRAALDQAHLPARCLILEITESVVMDNAQQAAAVLQRLKTLGVKVNIDDFGTGYSSLACLHRFPADTMKIDRSFVSRLDGNPENLEILRTIVTLAHNLNMTVTAEGVETEAQFAQLQELKCENSQGFLFSRPVSADGATALLRDAGREGDTRVLRASA